MSSDIKTRCIILWNKYHVVDSKKKIRAKKVNDIGKKKSVKVSKIFKLSDYLQLSETE